jgi:hypothetical protein
MRIHADPDTDPESGSETLLIILSRQVKRDPLETECMEDRSSVALCNLVRHGHELPAAFQNFDRIAHVNSSEIGNYGGSVGLADYCPYIQVTEQDRSEKGVPYLTGLNIASKG